MNPSSDRTTAYRRMRQAEQSAGPARWIVPLAAALLVAGGLLAAVGALRGGDTTVDPAPNTGIAETSGEPAVDRERQRRQLEADTRTATARREAAAAQQGAAAPAAGDGQSASAPGVTAAVAEPAAPTPTNGTRTIRFAFEHGPHGADAAMRRARDLQRPVLLYFKTDWCGYCRRFEAEYLPDPSVIRVLGDQFVAAQVNPEASASEQEVARRYEVTRFPTLLVVRGGTAERIVAMPRGGQEALAQSLAGAAL